MIRTRRNAVVVLSVAVILITVLLVAGFTLETSQKNLDQDFASSADFLLKIRAASALVTDMETGVRGYLLTGDESFLAPYNNANVQLPTIWKELGQQALALDSPGADNPALSDLLASMVAAANNWRIDWAEPQLALYKSGDAQAALSAAASDRGKQLFDKFRSTSTAVEKQAGEQLNIYNAQARQLSSTRQIVLLALGSLALVSVVWALLVLRYDANLQEEAMRAAVAETERLQTLVENMPLAVRLVSNPDGRIVLQNRLSAQVTPADLWNSMSEQERIDYYRFSRSDGTLLLPRDFPSAVALRDGVPVRDPDITMRVPNLGNRHMVVNAAPLKDQSGRVTAAVMVVEDVTAARELDQRKDEFIATAAHELRNPLTALTGYYQLIERAWQGIEIPGGGARHLEGMGRQIKRINALVERLLDASRIELGRIILTRSRFDLVRLAQTVIGEVNGSGNSTHPITLIAPEGGVTGSWDEMRIGQVISNLLGNAVRYSPPGTQVQVRISQVAPEVRVEVADRGPGVPPEQRQALFRRYYQADDNSQDDPQGEDPPELVHTRPVPTSKGLGLGLYISAEIVKSHGGRIGVEPNPGGGSIFWFTLPLD